MKCFFLILIFFNLNILYADQNDPDLNDLFNKLQMEEFANDQEQIVNDIWSRWGLIDDDYAKKAMDSIPLYFASQQYEEGIKILTSIINQFPNFSEAYNKRATIFFMMGDYNSSMIDIKNTLALEPRHFGALDGMARILTYYKKYNDAIDVYNKMKLLMPYDVMLDLKIERVRNKNSIST
ncbi:MAG: tetratricopeptide repeat protein [Alphaproteobacteria bacterium]|jgi:tetratricopeptide (TPR) repeat protein|tara:strand:- start:5404 stop:5943 length:540 start_codon:yes stop_codon:yes gene_type:complete